MTVYVHHLVLEVYVGPRPEGMKGLHYDDDPHHNQVDNLYWGTSSQNAYDKVRNGNHHEAVKVRCVWGHLLTHPNLEPCLWAKKGWRSCLACHKARGYLRKHQDLDHQTVSDFYYEKVMAS